MILIFVNCSRYIIMVRVKQNSLKTIFKTFRLELEQPKNHFPYIEVLARTALKIIMAKTLWLVGFV